MDLPIYVVIFDELILKAGWNISNKCMVHNTHARIKLSFA